MGALDNLYVSSSFQGLLKMTDSANGLTNTLQTVQTGDGDNSPLQMSLTQVNISGSLFVNGVQILGSSSGTSGTSGSSGSSGTAGSSGTSGSSGSGFTYNGVWDNAVNYNVNDVVLYNGQTYVAIQANVNKQPSVQPTFWQVFSAAGSSGTSGTSGTSGSSGSSGTSGSSGSSGTNGATGATGSSGTSGSNGSSGTSGVDGSSGTSGTSGDSGSSGTSGVVDYTGLITTGSVTTTQNITGSLILGNTVISGSLIGNAVNGGLLNFASEARLSGSVQLNISSSAPISSSNLLLNGGGPSAGSLTGSIVISGSNNIIMNPSRLNTLVTQGSYGYIGGNNIVTTIPTLNTASLVSPSILNNNLNGALFLTFTTSSVLPIPVIQNNINLAGTTINHPSGSVSFLGNSINGGGLTSNANTTTLSANLAIQANIFGGTTTTLNQNSSSIQYFQNIGGGVTVNNNYSSSVSTAVNNIAFGQNMFAGSGHIITVTGSNTANRRNFNGNTILGAANRVNSDYIGSTAGHLTSTAIIGQSLIVSASHTSTTNGGSTFVGRFNATGSLQESSQDAVFVVGTGTADNNRRNAIHVDSSNNTRITGSLQISGSLTLNGVTISGGSGSSGTSGTSGTSGVAGTSGSSGTSGVGGSSGTSGTSPSITGFITTGSVGQTQQITGSLRMSSGSLLLDNGEDAVKIADYFNRNALYKQESTQKLLLGGNCNMDQVGTQFGVTPNSIGLTVVGGNTLNFRTGSFNTFIGSGGALKSGSNNTFIGTSPTFSGGTGNFILGNFNSVTFPAADYNNLFSIGTTSQPSFIYKNDTNPLTIVSNTVISGSLSINNISTATGSFVVTTDSTGTLTKSPYSAVTSNLFSVGDFYSTQTQTLAAGVSGSVTYNNTGTSNGVSLVSSSQLTIANAGTYSITFSAQIKGDGGQDTVYMWLKKNGTNVADTATKIVAKNNEEDVMTVEYIVVAAANDYYELAWQNTTGDGDLAYYAASGNIPAIPSIITTVKQVR